MMVTSGAVMMCTFGAAPCVFQAVSAGNVLSKTPVGTMRDISPASIPTFGMCSSLMNPAVSAATAAALGVLTPMPCLPVAAGSWIGSPTVLIKGACALTTDSRCMCAYGGSISFSSSIQTKVIVK